MKTSFLLLLAALSLQGCAPLLNHLLLKRRMDTWLGADESSVFMLNGPPTRRQELNGITYDAWERCSGGGSTGADYRYTSSYGCRTTTLSVKEGKVVAWSIQ